jgi:UDP-N-acetylmuramate dehydrogenase
MAGSIMKIIENELLSKHSTWRVGGPARFFVEVSGSEELVEALEWAQGKGVEHVVIGGGTNILAADSGYDGLVIKMANREIVVEGDWIVAGAGALTSMVAQAAAKAGLSGLEWAVTIPGTIGGAVYGNAGCYGGEMSQVVEGVRVYRRAAGGARQAVLGAQDFDFAYRNSAFKRSDDIILGVTMKLRSGDKDQIQTKMNEYLEKRKKTQPLGSSCAGCVFKNPEGVSAGRVIDEAGLKGETIGGASVSEDHANFILNDGTATADQIVQLISLIKMKARDEYGVQLEEEIRYIGI